MIISPSGLWPKKVPCLLLLILLATLGAVRGQHFSVADNKGAQKIKSSSLLVVMEQEDPDMLKRYRHSEELLTLYKLRVAQYNATIEDAVKKEWHFTNGYTKVTAEELEQYKTKTDKEYSVLRLGEVGSYIYSGSTRPPNGYSNAPVVQINMLDKPKNEILAVMLPLQHLSPGVMAFIIQQCNVQLENCLNDGIRYFPALNKKIKSQTALLKGRTLLIAKEWADEDLLKEAGSASLGTSYPYPVKLVSLAELDKVILAHDKKYAYAIPVYSAIYQSGHYFAKLIVDPDKGDIIHFDNKVNVVVPLITAANLSEAAGDLK